MWFSDINDIFVNLYFSIVLKSVRKYLYHRSPYGDLRASFKPHGRPTSKRLNMPHLRSQILLIIISYARGNKLKLKASQQSTLLMQSKYWRAPAQVYYFVES